MQLFQNATASLSDDNKFAVEKYIEETLVKNKDCKILQCHFNDYTDFLKISFGKLPTDNSIVYRITIMQTTPSVMSNVSGHCDEDVFSNLVRDTMTQFTSVVKDKLFNNWETTFVIADSLQKRHDIKKWEGETVGKFVEIIDEIIDETSQVIT